MPRSRKSEQTHIFWDSFPADRRSLFRVPPELDLTPGIESNKQKDSIEDGKHADVTVTNVPSECTSRRRTNITSLPPEIILEIVSRLHPVDRVCLGLTCKSLLSSTLPTLQITLSDWLSFHDRRYSFILPLNPNLLVRLAHGWIPKDKFRYCYHCSKILPRSPEYFLERLRRKKSPRFRLGLGTTEKHWKSLSKKGKYAYLVENWCHSPEEDSSGFFCGHCYYRERDRINWPVYCPICLEMELTWTPPRKPWFRKALCRSLRALGTPFELAAYWVLVCCLYTIRFCYDQAMRCWRALT
ncbi:uncharacterized protein Z520_08313 [Fonsecaea multimorphosa CBS 102226]|uniref:F-box domain-containing protein n=1 Tax=Fonsecaea multimorphosa CBS 102226 TaxID=1442371 RepID=A0A0D2KHB7_9EURO|nr:uncharacterized protein Z520_08313 [Fonsecaea multimorphosa CBS 102226]KIX96058.1 hypothetical protein Z520_08313 [Fonsecaea multimorphosa CBS 102226]OAL21824.1 hypothetical protein AYO22_07766 [Fonsecaea multimorphosa]